MLDYTPADVAILQALCKFARTSPDPSTQNAACIVNQKYKWKSVAVNGWPSVIKNRDELWTRPRKYYGVLHAETRAIVGLTWPGKNKPASAHGQTMYAVWAACGPCASVIVEAGVTRLVTLASSDPAYVGPEQHDGTGKDWTESIEVGMATMREAGIEIVFVPHPVMDPEFSLLRSGKEFRP